MEGGEADEDDLILAETERRFRQVGSQVKSLLRSSIPRTRITRRRSSKAGLPPGSLVYVGDAKPEKVRMTLIDYDADSCTRRTLKKIEDAFPFKDRPTVTWINIDGLSDVEMISRLGERFGIHPLVLEDIVNTRQRPKLEVFPDMLFVVLRMIFFDEKASEVHTEQISLVVGPNYVISFQEREGDVFGPIRNRIKEGMGRVRGLGPDYLAYTLMDAIVDNYFSVMEQFSERITALEEELIDDPRQETLQSIHALRRELIELRRSVWPLREVINRLERSDSKLIDDATNPYFRDIYDHTIQVMDSIDTYRDMVSGLLDLYLSSVSNRMNEIMKVLTIIATIFIPLTFIAGIYGMNFDPESGPYNMPELRWYWGYPAAILSMVVITCIMLVYFRVKKWL